MAAEIRDRFPGTDVQLVRSSGGRFEVLVDGAPLFEKSKAGRFPHPGEIVQALEQRAS